MEPDSAAASDRSTASHGRSGLGRSAVKYQDLLILLFLAVLALIPRLYRLGQAPPGLNGDELFNAVDALSLGPGSWQIYFEGNFGREALYLYLMALPLNIFGRELWALRLASVLLGTGSTLLAYLIGKQAFNRRVGFVGGSLIAVSLWPLMLSRWGLRAVSLTFFTALTVYLYGRVVQRQEGKILGWLLAGLSLGLTFYTYIPARLFPLVIIGWLLWLSLLKRGWLRRHWTGIVFSLGVAALVFAPMGLYMIRYPEKFDQRVSGLWDSVEYHFQSEPNTLLERLSSVPLMFSFQGDTEGRYNLPGRPVFDPLTGLLFYLGLGISIWRAFRKGIPAVQRGAYGLLLLWSLVMLAPNFILGANTSFLRGAGAIVPIYLITACGLDLIYTFLRGRWPEREHIWRWSLALFVGLGILLTLADSWRAYFDRWINQPAAREAWHADLGLMGRYLAEDPPEPGEDIFIAYDYVLDASPQAFAYSSDLYPAWFDNQSSFVWRPGGREARYLISRERTLNGTTQALLHSLDDGEQLRYGNGDPALTVYHINPSDIDWEPESPYEVTFDSGPKLLGFDLPGDLFRGDTVTLIMHLEVPSGRKGLPNRLDYLQARLEDASGNVWSQAENLLGYPQSSWREGDRFVQLLELEIPAGMPPGPAYLDFGMRDADGIPYIVESTSHISPTGRSPKAGPLLVRSRPADEIVVDPGASVFDNVLALQGSRLSTLVAPGMPLDLSLDWLAIREPEVDYQVVLQLVAPDTSEILFEQRFSIWPETYPTSEWGAGEQVTSFHRLQIPVEVETGADPLLKVQLWAPGEGEPASLDQGSGEVAQLQWSLRDHIFEPPEIESPLEARFGDSIELLGYDLDASDSRPGGEVTLTLYWRALETPAEGYTVFNHLVGPEGQFRGQFDSPPVSEAWLTSTWLPGEIIVDRRVIPIHLDAPPGPVRLMVGLYTAGDLQRLPVIVDRQAQADDQLELAEVQIET